MEILLNWVVNQPRLYPFYGTAKLLKMQKISCKNHRILHGSFKHLRYVGGFATKLQKTGWSL